MRKKKSTSTTPTAKYYLFTITKREYEWLKESHSSHTHFKQMLSFLVEYRRPELSNYYIFITKEKNPYDPNDTMFFVCPIIPESQDKNMVIVLGGDPEFAKSFGRNIDLYTISNDDKDKILNFYKNMHRSLDKTRNDILKSLQQQHKKMTTSVQHKQVPIQSFYQKQINSYVNDLKKPIHKDHIDFKQIITKRRTDLIQKYLSNPSLSIDKLSKKNRSVVQQLIKQHKQSLIKQYGNSLRNIPQQIHPFYREKIMEYRKLKQKQQQQQKQHQQRLLMTKQDTKPPSYHQFWSKSSLDPIFKHR